MGEVYKITNKINNKCYIGITKHTFRERYNHRDDWWNAPRVNRKLLNAVKKYGPDNFKVEILLRCEHGKLEEMEIYYISLYNSFNDGYNLTSGGNYSYVISEETRIKNSESVKKQFKNGRVVWNKGKKLKSSHINKSTETKKKRFASGEITPWNKGKKTGRPSETAVINSAIAHKKPVECYYNGTLVKTYDGLVDTKVDGFNPVQVCLCCKGKVKTHKKHTFKYK